MEWQGGNLKPAAAISQRADWREAIADIRSQIGPPHGDDPKVDLAFLFASSAFEDHFQQLADEVIQLTKATHLVGCSGQGIIGPAREIEGEPALSLLTLSLPGASLQTIHLEQDDVRAVTGPDGWRRRMAVAADDVNAWLLFADPFSIDVETLLQGISDAYPAVPVVGGLASGNYGTRRTHVFADGAAIDHGAVALCLSGAYTIRTVVSQGCSPIGQTWTITSASKNIIQTIAGRPAYDVLRDTISELPKDMLQRVRHNLFVGIAMDEYQDSFGQGDFLVRNLIGADPENGSLAVGARLQSGQTLQFQFRDPQAADEELTALLDRTRVDLGDRKPIAAVLCACNGRGSGLFGQPNHDVQAIDDRLGPLPTTGFFCNGEIGPVGKRNFLHGYTASIALVVPAEVGET